MFPTLLAFDTLLLLLTDAVGVQMRPGSFLEDVEPAPGNGVAILKQLAFYEALALVQGFDSRYRMC